jgi:hypothetical protein
VSRWHGSSRRGSAERRRPDEPIKPIAPRPRVDARAEMMAVMMHRLRHPYWCWPCVALGFAFLSGESGARSRTPSTRTASSADIVRPSVIVQKQGFSTTTSAAGRTFITYGLVLVNRSVRLRQRVRAAGLHRY